MNRCCYLLTLCLGLAACGKLEEGLQQERLPQTKDFSLEEVAMIMSSLPLEKEQVSEVFDAVSSSASNGYDDEYPMSFLFSQPGRGVGESQTKAEGKSYSRPIREMLEDYFHKNSTKAAQSPQESIESLRASDIQIYWPYYKEEYKDKLPVITFDPGNRNEVNRGWRIKELPDGSRDVEEVIVDEFMAQNEPVWVINKNDDSNFTSLTLAREQFPERFSGGKISVTKTGESAVRTLVLKDVTMLRNYDSWFAGASEFFVKCGSVEDFTASTEAELKLYNPSISDFMVVIRRQEVFRPYVIDAVLVSQWCEQLDKVAFMMIEDDGGEQTSWKATTMVKINSKSYGAEVNLPFKTKDDIVWRGQLSGAYLEKNSGQQVRFGDLRLRFEFIE